MSEILKFQDKWLVITREFDAPRELVWRAWTEPERFKRWWGPQGYTTPFCKIDLRQGGVMHFCMRSPQGQDIWCGGVIRELDPPSRLVFTDYFADEQGHPVSPSKYGMSAAIPEDMLITVTLTEKGGKTKLTMEQTIPEAVAKEIGAPAGWNQSFDRLAAYLAKP